ncbi:hypothetical protein Moror_13068 [Moniliophthora roreri MCA 2997]|uniref:DUF6534 domain-containing protein n=1 Tax=Moniliophthora roreri (strain MCA 2997) TaxID=1381753 RepID=V2X3V8_MONRO|nr:hypothetical protein Moror_13068 [Moniliophthora roreri MCA 2997]KAI3604380.1 hypothetical protein WG66_008468 [Moniliophthora roreri]
MDAPNNTSQLAGPLLLGYLLNYGLYGILIVQIYLYWAAFPYDNRLTQALVYCLYGLETTQTIVLSHDAFQSFVYGFANPVAVNTLHLLWLHSYLIDGIVAFFVHIYYARRIHVLLRGTKIIPGMIVLLATTQFVASVRLSITARDTILFSDGYHYRDVAFVPSITKTVCAVVVDVLIAITMIYALSQFDTTFRETQNLLSRLNRLSVETGSLIAVASLLQPLLWILFINRIYYVTPAIITTKLYSNSLLAVLNGRVQIHGERGGSTRNTSSATVAVTVPRSAWTRQSRIISEGWVPSTFPSRLDDLDGFSLSEAHVDASETKASSRITR